MKSLRRILTVLAVAAALCAAAPVTSADEEGWTPGKKLGRAFIGLVFGWLELPGQMYDTATKDGPGMAATVGFAKGLGKVCARYIVSTVEFLTFPVPINDYKPLLTEEYPWGAFATEGTITVPAPTSSARPAAPAPRR
ncbi:MAG: exosortase system-associated protein, TIGR04073 family [Verrucomicrobia bacterium]|nr:exosortase system-associated protein, TIGR04073 family [Verrucomicrobiota bacterium]